jgi:hypothetical protein
MPNVRVANILLRAARPKFAVSLVSNCVRIQSTRDWCLTLASTKCDIFVSDIKQNEQTDTFVCLGAQEVKNQGEFIFSQTFRSRRKLLKRVGAF